MISNLLLLIDSTSIKLYGIFGQLNTKVHFKNYTINPEKIENVCYPIL